jgi:putative protein-disulfide isomerase
MVNPMPAAATLHYIHDPLCGWCYGAAPGVKAARALLPVQAHGGGMMAARPITAQLRGYVMAHDRRIAEASGQPFGTAYFDGLLRDTGAVFDSRPPIAAMLAADTLAGRGLDLLARMQSAHYVEGRRIAERDVLLALAAEIGLDRAAFAQALQQAEGDAVAAHIADTRRLMARLGVQGFPAFALEQRGELTLLDAADFIGRPEALRATLQQLSPAVPATAEPAFGCSPDGCTL